MVNLAIAEDNEESNMPYQESEGWRSWGCVRTLVLYLISLLAILWFAVLSILFYFPYVCVAIVIGFAIAYLGGYLR